jgi:hypothetical protein
MSMVDATGLITDEDTTARISGRGRYHDIIAQKAEGICK